MSGLKSYFGNRQYYKNIIVLMLPILLQNLITNLVNLLDNIMVGQLGTECMSGVAISNQLIFIFNLFIFGGLSGAGIFSAQFFGKWDHEGVRQTVRMKIIIALLGLAIFISIFWIWGSDLITLFLHEGTEKLNLDLTLTSGIEYLRVMTPGLIPFAGTFVYASTLRESGETLLPMKAIIIAVVCNLIGNYIFIFGKLGAPEMGVTGAALATVISRFVEFGILLIYSHKHIKRFSFLKGLYSSFYIRKSLLIDMIKKGTPLLVNELLWSAGMAMLNQCYSIRGLEVVSATNISTTVSNLFMCVVFAIGTTITIVIGQTLGAGNLEGAVADFKKITVMSVATCIVVGAALALLAHLIAGIYNTTDVVRQMATSFMIIVGIFMPIQSFINCCYFTLRSGGKTIITFVFDSAFLWVCNVLVAFILTRFTTLPILTIYLIVNCMDIIRCFIGFFMVKSRRWLVNLVEEKE